MTEETKDYGIAVGDKVKPHPEFNFDLYSGPASLDEVGYVVQVDEPDEGSMGKVWVQWPSKEEGDLWDHSFGDLKGFAEAHDSSEEWGVIKVEG